MPGIIPEGVVRVPRIARIPKPSPRARLPGRALFANEKPGRAAHFFRRNGLLAHLPTSIFAPDLAVSPLPSRDPRVFLRPGAPLLMCAHSTAHFSSSWPFRPRATFLPSLHLASFQRNAQRFLTLLVATVTCYTSFYSCIAVQLKKMD
jgi:hypothetical protein